MTKELEAKMQMIAHEEYGSSQESHSAFIAGFKARDEIQNDTFLHFHTETVSDLLKKNTKLFEELREAREVIELYAAKSLASHGMDYDGTTLYVNEDDFEELSFPNGKTFLVSGKHARDYLAKVGK